MSQTPFFQYLSCLGVSPGPLLPAGRDSGVLTGMTPSAKKMYDQRLTLRYFNCPRAGTNGGGRTGHGPQGAHRLPSRVSDHRTSPAGSHLHGDQESLKVQRRGETWGQGRAACGVWPTGPHSRPSVGPRNAPRRGTKRRARTLHGEDPERPGLPGPPPCLCRGARRCTRPGPRRPSLLRGMGPDPGSGKR